MLLNWRCFSVNSPGRPVSLAVRWHAVWVPTQSQNAWRCPPHFPLDGSSILDAAGGHHVQCEGILSESLHGVALLREADRPALPKSPGAELLAPAWQSRLCGVVLIALMRPASLVLLELAIMGCKETMGG
jgi:hypothetical protein